MMQKSLGSKIKKTIAIVIAVVLIVSVIGFITYSIATTALPRKTTSETKDPTAATKAYEDAISAEQKRNFAKAAELYEQALPYYQEKGKESVMDKNKAYGIEARIVAMKKQEEVRKANAAAEQSNPAIQYSK